MPPDMHDNLACKQEKRTIKNRCTAASYKNQRVSRENGIKITKRVREEDDENTDNDTVADE